MDDPVAVDLIGPRGKRLFTFFSLPPGTIETLADLPAPAMRRVLTEYLTEGGWLNVVDPVQIHSIAFRDLT